VRDGKQRIASGPTDVKVQTKAIREHGRRRDCASVGNRSPRAAATYPGASGRRVHHGIQENNDGCNSSSSTLCFDCSDANAILAPSGGGNERLARPPLPCPPDYPYPVRPGVYNLSSPVIPTIRARTHNGGRGDGIMVGELRCCVGCGKAF